MVNRPTRKYLTGYLPGKYLTGYLLGIYRGFYLGIYQFCLPIRHLPGYLPR